MKMTSFARLIDKKIRKDVMAYAWKIAKAQAKEDNCTARECFAWALRMAWESLKMLCTVRKGFRKEENKYGAFLHWTSDWAELADMFPHVCRKVWAILDKDSDSILYIGSLKECESFRWSHTWYEFFNHLEHTYYTQGFDCPLLWT